MAENEDTKTEVTEASNAEQHDDKSVGEAASTAGSEEDVKASGPSASSPRSHASEQGEIKEDDEATEGSQAQLLQSYHWCKCACDPAQFNGQDHYYLHMDTQQSRWEEPREPYWLWDSEAQAIDPKGLQQPSSDSMKADEPDPEYYGYNPKIHGSYDPNAPYAKYHSRKREQESAEQNGESASLAAARADYASAGTFNRFTGAFQHGDVSAERHNDYNKSGRQMGTFFDVDAAANSHDGRSLKEERRHEKLSKKQIKELAEKRRAKKEKKRMDFYKS